MKTMEPHLQEQRYPTTKQVAEQFIKMAYDMPTNN